MANESKLSSQQVEAPLASVKENIQEGFSVPSYNLVKAPKKQSERYQNTLYVMHGLLCELEKSKHLVKLIYDMVDVKVEGPSASVEEDIQEGYILVEAPEKQLERYQNTLYGVHCLLDDLESNIHLGKLVYDKFASQLETIKKNENMRRQRSGPILQGENMRRQRSGPILQGVASWSCVLTLTLFFYLILSNEYYPQLTEQLGSLFIWLVMLIFTAFISSTFVAVRSGAPLTLRHFIFFLISAIVMNIVFPSSVVALLVLLHGINFAILYAFA